MQADDGVGAGVVFETGAEIGFAADADLKIPERCDEPAVKKLKIAFAAVAVG